MCNTKSEPAIDKFKLESINAFKDFNFFVDDYQRGYKWTCQEVLDLLNDIDDFKQDQGIYCLQPIVVKALDNDNPKIIPYFKGRSNIYELIDGQQRLTTIYIILSHINGNIPLFEIAYNTRPESAKFLMNIKALPIEVSDYLLIDNTEKLEEEINKCWQEYVHGSKQNYDNVDNYHFYTSSQTVQLWFSNKNEAFVKDFKTKLLEYTQVIWYQVDNEQSERVFMNINSGKIALTNAELIKALFLIHCKEESNPELADYIQNGIAQEWDKIETHLQNNDFWYFINEDPEKNDKATRIDFLFDILKRKSANEKDPYFTYRKYTRDFKENKGLNWKEVKDLFDILWEWYEDRRTYHLIGYIICQKFGNIQSLLEKSNGMGKNDFKEYLVNIIRNRFNTQKDNTFVYDIDNLNYKNLYKESKTVLLLFNIETYEKSDPSFRFPFYSFKKEKWSIEHIHAQKAELLTTNKELEEWKADVKILLQDQIEKDGKENKRVVNQANNIKNEIDRIKVDDKEFISKEVKDKLKDLNENIEEFLSLHSIANLALLDSITNSQLNNENFLKKRNIIINIDKKGWIKVNNEKRKAFIPICTKNVFFKYYTEEARDIQMTYWGYQDRKGYKEAIELTLEKYYNN